MQHNNVEMAEYGMPRRVTMYFNVLLGSTALYSSVRHCNGKNPVLLRPQTLSSGARPNAKWALDLGRQ